MSKHSTHHSSPFAALPPSNRPPNHRSRPPAQSAQPQTWDFTPLHDTTSNYHTSGIMDIDDDNSVRSTGSNIVVSSGTGHSTMQPEGRRRIPELRRDSRMISNGQLGVHGSTAAKKRPALSSFDEVEIVENRPAKKMRGNEQEFLAATSRGGTGAGAGHGASMLGGRPGLGKAPLRQQQSQQAPTPRPDMKVEQQDAKPLAGNPNTTGSSNGTRQAVMTPWTKPKPETTTNAVNRKPAAAPLKNPAIFDLDSSDEDEATNVMPPQKLVIAAPKNVTEKQRERERLQAAQRMASDRLRQEAVEKKQGRSSASRSSSVQQEAVKHSVSIGDVSGKNALQQPVPVPAVQKPDGRVADSMIVKKEIMNGASSDTVRSVVPPRPANRVNRDMDIIMLDSDSDHEQDRRPSKDTRKLAAPLTVHGQPTTILRPTSNNMISTTLNQARAAIPATPRPSQYLGREKPPVETSSKRNLSTPSLPSTNAMQAPSRPPIHAQIDGSAVAAAEKARHDAEIKRRREEQEKEEREIAEADAIIEAEAREREKEARKHDAVRRQIQEQKDRDAQVIRQAREAALAKKRAEEAQQRAREEAVRKKREDAAREQEQIAAAERDRVAAERELRKQRDADEADRAGEEARRKQQDVKNKIAKRLAEAIPEMPQPVPATTTADRVSIECVASERTTLPAPENVGIPLKSDALAVSDAELVKQQRIQTKKDRNERNQRLESENAERDDLTNEEVIQTKPAQYRGRSEIAHSRDDGFAPLPGLGISPKSSRLGPLLSKPHLRKITINDVRLLQLKHDGLKWDQVPVPYHKATGIPLLENALRTRWTQVKALLDADDEPVLDFDEVVEGISIEQLRDMLPNGPAKPPPPRGYTIRLDEITASDAKIITWKAEGITLESMVPLLAQETGLDLTKSTLKKRHSLITAALRGVELNDIDLLANVAKGDRAAQERLNQLVGAGTATNTPPPTPPRKKNHDAALGEVSSADIQLVRWRDKGTRFSDLPAAYQALCGKVRSDTTLRKRYGQVKIAVRGIDADLLDRVVADETGAVDQLNRLIHGDRPETGNTPGGSFDSSSTLSGSQRADSPAEFVIPAPASEENRECRPTTAGKKLDEALWAQYIEALALEWAREEAETSDEEDLEDETPDPYYNKYTVQRRAITQAELDDGDELDDRPWITYGEDMLSKQKANGKARSLTLENIDPVIFAEMIRSAGLVWNLNEHGLVYATVTTPGGIVETRVEQRLHARKPNEQQPKIDREELLSRTVYYVKERRVKIERCVKASEDESVDAELFGEDAEVTTIRTLLSDKTVDETAYSALELANKYAIKHWTKEVWHSSSVNLDQRTLEETDLREELVHELQDQQDDTFFERVETFECADGTTEEVSVYIAKGPLCGARNI
ncbi:hypothetical protein LTR56_008892 [Elasticomyces elasticus]|nr:hypothetical protein LTR56_008892 [Elasticomyces elasticus]KAK3663123.1 hypothetical protein LTR22_006032 [Elasticomyces elasticus]KAK4924019.1 hypothetical protein LTR49_008759 [Elasticomyces elasticus]KAK5764376.1 hypothetical protein LTS12_005352 [Elasticomyces elasticus]